MAAKKNFLIIIGGQRCGSSAIFEYLSEHPNIISSLQKETRYFLDKDYIIKQRPRYEYDGQLETYLKLFPELSDLRNEKWYMDSTPDYMNSPGTAARMKEFFKDNELKLIAILRDPVQRFLSWYNYDKQLNNISIKMPLSEYLSKNMSNSTEPPFRRLDTGCYSQYLKVYQNLFPDQLTIYRFEDLRNDKRSLLADLLLKMNLDPDFDLKDSNPKNMSYVSRSQILNSIYMICRNNFQNIIPYDSALYKVLRKTSKGYQKLNYVKAEKEKVDDRTLQIIRDFYKKEYVFLEGLSMKQNNRL